MKQFVLILVLLASSIVSFAYMGLDADAEMAKAETLILSGQREKAEAGIAKIIKTYSEYGPAYARLARLRLEQGDKEGAVQNIFRALRSGYGLAEVEPVVPEIVEAAPEKLLELLDAERCVFGSGPAITYWAGRCYELLGQFEDARLTYKSIVAKSDSAQVRLKKISGLEGKPAVSTGKYQTKVFSSTLEPFGTAFIAGDLKLSKTVVKAVVDTCDEASSYISRQCFDEVTSGRGKVRNGKTKLRISLGGKVVGTFPFELVQSKQDCVIAKDILEKMGEWSVSDGTLTVESTIFSGAEKPAAPHIMETLGFRGGNTADFSKWVGSSLQFPEIAAGKRGVVMLAFTIDKEGNVRDVRVAKSSSHYALDSEAVKVASSSPKWTPANIDGKAVNVCVTLPVIFK